jgi:hypothetical protein
MNGILAFEFKYLKIIEENNNIIGTLLQEGKWQISVIIQF